MAHLSLASDGFYLFNCSEHILFVALKPALGSKLFPGTVDSASTGTFQMSLKKIQLQI